MNHPPLILLPPRLIGLGCFAALFASAALGAQDPQPAGDTGFVAKGDTLPNEIVTGKGDVGRLMPLLEQLLDGQRLKLEFTTVSKSLTGYPEDLRYARLVTTVDSQERPDGLEVEYLDWYRPPARKTLYKQGVKNGVEQIFHPGTDKLQQEIPWVNGRIEGVKKAFHENGKPSVETPYSGGVISGEVKSFTDQGGLLRVARFSAGVRDGEMIDYWPDREKAIDRTIPYRKGRIEGMARAYYADGKPKWEKPFRNNVQHGVEKEFAPDGTLERERHWIDGDTVTAEEFATKFKP
jgi:antitoxin component YwqK of YwqJK toxin-antitoxin module